jgi:hypothetical protein
LRKRRAESASGASREGERERTADDVSKCALDIETGSGSLAGDEPGGYLFTAQVVSGMEAARARLRLWCGTWEPVAPIATTVHWVARSPGREREDPELRERRGAEYRGGAQGRIGPW